MIKKRYEKATLVQLLIQYFYMYEFFFIYVKKIVDKITKIL